MTKMRRFLAGMLLVVCLATFSACGYNARTAYTIDGVEIPAGVYIRYLLDSVTEAYSLTGDSDKSIFEQEVEGQKAADWIKNNARENCLRFAATEIEFDAMELSFTEEEEEEIANAVESYWNYSTYDADYNQVLYSDICETEGISKDSMAMYVRNGYKKQKIFDAYYAEDGIEEVPESTLKEYFLEEYNLASYLSFYKKDGETDEMLTDEEIAELKKEAEGYVDRINAGEDLAAIGAEHAKKVAEGKAVDADDGSNQVVGNETTDLDDATSNLETSDDTSSTADDTSSDTSDDTSSSDTTDDGTDSNDDEEVDYSVNGYTTTDVLMPRPGSDMAENSSYGEEQMQGVEDVDIGKAKLVDTEFYIYVVTKSDLSGNEEMFTERRDSTLYNLKYKDFNQLLLDMCEGYSINENGAAVRRYTPQKLKTVE